MSKAATVAFGSLSSWLLISCTGVGDVPAEPREPLPPMGWVETAARLLSTWLGPLPTLTAPLVVMTVGTLAVATALALVGPLGRARRVQPMALLRDL